MTGPPRQCAFCQGSQDDRNILIAAPPNPDQPTRGDVYICDRCVSVCREMITTERVREERILWLRAERERLDAELAGELAAGAAHDLTISSPTPAAPTLRAWRERAGLSQIAAGQRFGLSQGEWSKLEHGLRRPRPALAKRLVEGTGVPLSELLGIADPPKPE